MHSLSDRPRLPTLHRASTPALRAQSPTRSPRTVVAWLTGRRAVRWGALWGLAYGYYIAESALAYKAVGGTPAARERLAQTLGTNKGMAALFGPAFGLDTVGGFTAWRALGFLSLVGAVIGLLMGTSALRGQEEAGRWEMLLSGQVTRRGAAAQAMAGLGAGLAALFAVAAAVAVAGGRRVTPPVAASGMLMVSLLAVLITAVFVAVGVLMGQLSATRRQASVLSAVVFAAAFLIRAAADASPGLRWARWATPLGWPAQFHAFTGSRPVALIPPLATVLVLSVAALVVADRRDLGAAVLPDPDTAKARTGLLGGQAGLAVRLTRPLAYGWIAGLAVGGLFLGLIAQSASESVSGSKAVNDALARLGAHRTGAESYLGFAFVMVAVLVAFAGATVVNATRGEEAGGMVDNLLVRPVSRTRWLLCRVAVAAVLALICGVVAGLAAWAGAASQHTGIGFGTMVQAGLNTVPPALLLIGLGTAVHAVAPRATAVAVYAVLGWSFLMQILGSFAGIDHWVLDTSILHHSAPAPAADPNWVGAAVMTGLAVVAVAVAAVAFRRRDLAGQ
ncbi:ABC-2 type transport system permease protein [Catenulispora sp. GP43]|uniref:hypothetical protein n=1 Tax=Catenulispora sp. GP43 TaxID=3156263 RepID=UPI0035166CBA